MLFPRRPFQAIIKNLRSGCYDSFVHRGVSFGEPGKSKSRAWNNMNWPAILQDEEGNRWGGAFTHDQQALNLTDSPTSPGV